MPFLRYQTPSRVRQTSSASILPPLVNRMTGLPPRRVPVPGPLVEMGSRLAVVCNVSMRVGEGFGVGEGDGEGETDGEGEGSGGGEVSCAIATGAIAYDCSSTCNLNPR